MINPVDQFKARLLKLELGEPYIYFRGHLASARAHMPDLDTVGGLAYGLHLLGLVSLCQYAIGDEGCAYVLRVLGPIRNVDFDKGLGAFIKSISSVKETV